MSIPPSKASSSTIYPHQFTVYLDDEAGPAVRAYAQASGVKVSVALRELIEFGIEAALSSEVAPIGPEAGLLTGALTIQADT